MTTCSLYLQLRTCIFCKGLQSGCFTAEVHWNVGRLYIGGTYIKEIVHGDVGRTQPRCENGLFFSPNEESIFCESIGEAEALEHTRRISGTLDYAEGIIIGLFHVQF